MDFLNIWFPALALLTGFGTVLWIISLIIKDSSIIDPLWGVLFIITGWLYFFEAGDGFQTRKMILLSLVTLWGLRLSVYLAWRNWGEGEDYRYQKFRKNWGKNYWWGSLIQVFWFQPFLAWLISAVLLGGMIGSLELNWLDFLGIGVWLVGFLFEAGGDFQLMRFKSNPENKGKLLTSGFWKYTRHPNYFGDAACWWGYGLICAATGSYLPLLGSVLMTFLLLKVSGVALLEQTLKKSKPGYEEYVRKTNAFLPWFPKK